MPCAIAIDIGASSGRHIYAELQDGILRAREIYRFENDLQKQDGHLVWNIENLKTQVLCGLKIAGESGLAPDTVAIDTWGVDYVLLDENDREILPVYAYRDNRTDEVIDKVERLISAETLYAHSGIPKQKFNTLYQLYCDVLSGRLQKAERFLMMPEYLAFTLCGRKANEYTNATTTGLIHAENKDWDQDVLRALQIPARLFDTPLPPATPLGEFTQEVQKAVGYNARVVLCATHDTASAVLACPLEQGDAYISSGTWSLMGVELDAPITTPAARNACLTNEGGIGYRYRFLKNIMGLWMIQSIRRETGKKYSYAELSDMARQSNHAKIVDVNHPDFFAPDSMTAAVRAHLQSPDLPLGDLLNCVYHSLAKSYADTVTELERITRSSIRNIRIIGGGCQDGYLNQLTAEYTGRPVSTGPVEATAVGNLICQFMATDPSLSIRQAREIVRKSFDIKEI